MSEGDLTKERLNGLDLFSGIGGITLALSEWVNPVAYCEIEPYAQKVLLSRMSDGQLPIAPIWDDVRTLQKSDIKESVDIIYGGFPCQDISVAGRKAGITKESRSGLFYKIMRLTDELKPQFLFLENVPNIRNQGLDKVLQEITDRGYNCRWGILSAAEVGAWHQRKRWWLLGYSKRDGRFTATKQGSFNQTVFDSQEGTNQTEQLTGASASRVLAEEFISDSDSKGLEGQQQSSGAETTQPTISRSCWWQSEPAVGRVVNGLPSRVDRVKCLGNAVVPECAKEAFKRLTGLI